MTLDELVLRMGAPFSSACEQFRRLAEASSDETVVVPVTLRGGRQTTMRLVELIGAQTYRSGFYLEQRSPGCHHSMPRLFWCGMRPKGQPLALVERDWWQLKSYEREALIHAAR